MSHHDFPSGYQSARSAKFMDATYDYFLKLGRTIMTTVFDGVRYHTHYYSLSVSAIFIVTVTGAYFYVIGSSSSLEVKYLTLSRAHSSASDVTSTASFKIAMPVAALVVKPSLEQQNLYYLGCRSATDSSS